MAGIDMGELSATEELRRVLARLSLTEMVAYYEGRGDLDTGPDDYGYTCTDCGQDTSACECSLTEEMS